MRRAGGYLAVFNADGSKTEADSFTCSHCQRVVFVKPKAPPAECGGWCGRCAKPICGPCAARPGCTPFEKRLERVEARARLLKAIGVAVVLLAAPAAAQVQLLEEGTNLGEVTRLNCTGGGLTCSINGRTGTLDATAGGSGAPTNAKYVVQQCHADLSAEQCLGDLTTGLVRVAATTGVLSTAEAGVDYAAASHTHAGGDVTSAVATATALATNPADCGASQFCIGTSASGACICAQVEFGNISGTASSSQMPNPGAGSKGGVESKTCSGTDKVSAIGTDGVPVCSADQTGGGGGFPTATLTNDVTCAVSASYCTIFNYTPGASKKIVLTAWLVVNSASTTVAPQFRVSSADTGYTGRCTWAAYSAAVATTTAPVYDNVAIGTSPADTADTAWGSTADHSVTVLCNLASDASPGAILIEWQLETGTSPTQTVRAGSYYVAVTN